MSAHANCCRTRVSQVSTSDATYKGKAVRALAKHQGVQFAGTMPQPPLVYSLGADLSSYPLLLVLILLPKVPVLYTAQGNQDAHGR